MTLETLSARLSARTGRTVMAAPRTLDEDPLRELAATDALVLVLRESWATAAALAAVAAQGSLAVAVGELAVLEETGEDLALHLGRGRVVDAQEWKVDRAAALWGRSGAARLPRLDGERPRALAENPFPPSPRVLRALAQGAQGEALNRYPPLRPTALEAALAAKHGCAPEEVVVAPGGSQEILARCVRAFTNPRETVTAAAPTYDHLATICAREGRRFALSAPGRPGPENPALVYVASPNNPDSRLFSPVELAQRRAALAPDRVLLLDRAWAGFQGDDELFAPRPPGAVVVVQTFSKLFGIAGLRLGYALAPAPLADLLRRHSPAYEVPKLSEDAALASLDDAEYRTFVRTRVALAREKLATRLEAIGWRVPRTTTHVLLAWPPSGAYARVVDSIEAQALPIEECPQVDGALQLAVPAPEAVDALVDALP